LTQDPVLPPQTVELSPLVTIKPGPGAASDVRAFHPLPERVAAHAQLVSYLLQRPPALAEQPYRLDLELKRVGRISGSSLHGQSFPSNLAQAGICPPKRGNSRTRRSYATARTRSRSSATSSPTPRPPPPTRSSSPAASPSTSATSTATTSGRSAPTSS